MIRIFVLLGQGGAATSYGMYGLARQLRALSRDIVCTVHGWDDLQAVIRMLPTEPTRVVMIGFSLGANSCTQIAAMVDRKIALLVAYDASALQTGLNGGGIKPIGPNVARTLCYRSTNLLMPFGHGQLYGHGVETTLTSDLHVTVCYDAALHAQTVDAVKALL